MAEQDKTKDAAKKAAAPRTNQSAPGTTAPEPKATPERSETLDQGKTQASSPEVTEQREQEQQAALAAAKAEQETAANGPATPAEKGQQTRAASDVREQAAADAEARAQAQAEDGVDKSETEEQDGTPKGRSTSGRRESPASRQRREEQEARDAKVRAATDALSEKDQRLLAAAPGGQRTAMTDGKEGSTTVKHTAAYPRPALSGPLDAPVTRVENYAATEEDPDNRVYADEAGPRDVFEGTEPVKARYVDSEGNALDYDAIFDDVDGKTFVMTKTRVYETFVFPNTTTEGKRLAYAPGKRVPRGEAENVRNQISVHSPIL